MQTREIRVFISSTFNDMHPERDWLVKRTFPRLREMAAKRGVTLTEVDLRWGITEKEAREGKTISICLDEIINSRPFFIGLLGNRYGWTPSVEDLKLGDLPERYEWVTDDLNNQLSITEIEMQYGVLRNTEDIFASFYIREGGTDDDPRQTSLKETVKNQSRYPVNYYSSPEELGQQVEIQFRKILDSLYPVGERNTALAVRMGHLTWAEVASRYYLPDPRTLAVIDRVLSSDQPVRMLVTGSSGSGKSALLSFIAAREMNNPERFVVAHFPGVARHDSSAEVAKRLCNECKMSCAGTRLLIIVDDVASIMDENGNVDMSWMDVVPANATLLVSAADGQEVTESLKSRIGETLTVLPLLLSQRRKLADNYFKAFSKHLEDSDLEIIGQPSRVTDNTLAYVTLLEELRCFGSFDGLSDYIGIISGFDYASEFYDFILREKEKFYSTERNPDIVRLILSLLALSSDGLTEHEIASITGIPQMHISQFVLGNTFLIKRNGGLLRMAHSRIEESVVHRYLIDEEYVSALREEMITYFESEEADTHRRDVELPYQYWKIQDYYNLYLYVSKLKYIQTCIEQNRLFFLRYWSSLLDISPSLFPVAGCLDTMPLPASDTDKSGLMEQQLWNETFVNIQSDLLLRFAYLIISHLHHYDSVAEFATRVLLMLGKDATAGLRSSWLSLLGTIFGRTGQYDKALRMFARALEEANKKNMDEMHTLLGNIAETYMTIAEETDRTEFFERAASIQRMVLDYRIGKYGYMHPETAVAMDNLAGSLFALGDEEEATQLTEESGRIYAQVNGDMDIDTAVNLVNQGKIALKNKNYNLALELGQRVEKAILALSGQDNLHLIDAYVIQAVSHAALRHDRETGEALKKFIGFIKRNPNSMVASEIVLSMMSQALKTDHYNLVGDMAKLMENRGFDNINDEAVCLNMLGKALASLNEFEESKNAYAKAIDIYIEARNHDEAVKTAAACGSAFSLAGKLEEALVWFEKAFHMNKEFGLASDEQLAYSWQNYAVTLYNLGWIDEASGAMKHACDIRRELFGDSDEMLSEDYAPLLDKMADEANTLTLTEEYKPQKTDDSVEQIFKSLIDDRKFTDLFSEGMSYFRKGSLSHALQIFSRLKHSLYKEDAPVSAIAWVIRTIAYTNELMKTPESNLIAINQYKEAIDMAIREDNPVVLEYVAFDYAEFLWTQYDYYGAIGAYTYQMAGAFRQRGITDPVVTRCLGNMASAMLQTENPRLDFVVNCSVAMMMLCASENENQYTGWAEQFLRKALSMQGRAEDDFEPNPVETIARIIDFFADLKLYDGAQVVSHIFTGIPEDMFSTHDRFSYLLALSRVDTSFRPTAALMRAWDALKFAKDHPDEVVEDDYDRLYIQLGMLYISYCQFKAAADNYQKVKLSTIEAVENELKCAFVNSDTVKAAEVLESLSGDEHLFAPAALELGRFAAGQPFDMDILRSKLNPESPSDALFLILAFQRSGAETEAHDLFAQLADRSFDNVYMEMTRLYAIVSYFRAAHLDDEAEIYRNLAVNKFDALDETDRRIFTNSFSMA